jgi:hypothetical protein
MNMQRLHKLYVGLLFVILMPIVVPLASPPFFVFVTAWLTDKTDWRIEDYMCTIPEGCKEYVAERKRAREQLRTLHKSN